MEFLSELNYPAILVGTVLAFLVGWLWYSPVLFAKPWGAHYKVDPEAAKSGMAMAMILGFVVTFLIGLVMAIAMEGGIAYYAGASAAGDMVFSLKLALLCGGGFAFLPMLLGAAYVKKPLKILLIEGVYIVLIFVIFALVISGWHEVF